MLIIRHLDALRRHGEWADARLIEALRAAPAAVPTALREMAHVRGAQEIWLSRIEGRAATVGVWPEVTIEELARIGVAADLALGELIAGLTDEVLDRAISYTSLAGKGFTTPLGEILLHLLLHGHYHRGKANAALRAAGAEPASVDYIAWQRTIP